MEAKRRLSTTTAALSMLLLTVVLMNFPAAKACPSDGSQCRSCILDRFKSDCPPCVPILRCMAKCLWGGTTPGAKCAKQCDCNEGYPRLSDCKKCMSKCKCSCSVA